MFYIIAITVDELVPPPPEQLLTVVLCIMCTSVCYIHTYYIILGWPNYGEWKIHIIFFENGF